VIAAVWLACLGGGPAAAPVTAAPSSLAHAECAVCGMVVSEQPSPRGQVVYRDGTHAHVCSIEELRALAQERSARGAPVAVYVEVLPASFDPSQTDAAPLPWSPADEARFVFGASRRGVMGEPVLSFVDPAAAHRAAAQLGTEPVDWSALRDTPFHQVPAAAGAVPTP